MSQIFTNTPQSQPHLPFFTHPNPNTNNNGFPMVAIVVIGIGATAFLLISYYMFLTKCNFHWQQVDLLSRRRTPLNDDPLASSSPSPLWQSRGLDERLIRELPVLEFNQGGGERNAFLKCVVCLNEFQDHDLLRVLPKCSHAFHLDCIDVWLQNNSNCPLCRSTISGRNRYRFERVIAPTSSPQDPQPLVGSIVGGDEDFVVIELSADGGTDSSSRRFLMQPRSHSSRKFGNRIRMPKAKKSRHVSMAGDERINVRETEDQFSVQPIRRSFSMDSAVDRHVYLSMRESLRENRWQFIEGRGSESASTSTSRRSIFSFGIGKGSRNAVFPV